MVAPVLLYLGAASAGAGLQQLWSRWSGAPGAGGPALGDVAVVTAATQAELDKVATLVRPEDAVAINAQIVLAVSTRNVALFVEGVIIGFGKTEVPDLQAAATDFVNMYGELMMAFQSFQQSTEEGVMAGLGHLSAALRDLQALLKDSKLTESELQHVIDVFRTAKFIFHVGQELRVNGKDILKCVQDALAAWQAGNFKASGESIGHALAVLAG